MHWSWLAKILGETSLASNREDRAKRATEGGTFGFSGEVSEPSGIFPTQSTTENGLRSRPPNRFGMNWNNSHESTPFGSFPNSHRYATDLESLAFVCIIRKTEDFVPTELTKLLTPEMLAVSQ